ncbi:MAG: methionine--tRNA ligase [Victivallaceae bacterium]
MNERFMSRKKMREKVLITAALPYANGPLHFGHIAGVYLPADCCARFHRLIGSDVIYICGSDEYGIAITLNAEHAGIPFKEYVDYYHNLHLASFRDLNIVFDYFSRTTSDSHAPLVIDFYNDLKRGGYIEEKETEQLFSEQEDRFLADRYVTGKCPYCKADGVRGDECGSCGASYEATDLIDPRSKINGKSLVLKKTRHDFLKLELFKEFLEKRLKERPFRPNVQKFVLEYLKNLRSRAITRDLNWGVPVPGKESKVFYVWFDAPIGYVSATLDWADKVKNNRELWKDYWLKDDVKYIEFIGKDNIVFHAVIFPSMEEGQSLPYKQVDDLVASEFYTLEGKQFSKSDGHFIDIDDFLSKYSVDTVRYFLASGAPETSDSNFSFEEFKSRCNADLVGKYGNFINRVLSFADKNGFKTIKAHSHLLNDENIAFMESVKNGAREAYDCYTDYSIRRATQAVMEVATLGNVYFNSAAPWKLIKDSSCREKVENILFCCLFCQKILALISYPLIPETSIKILNALGIVNKEKTNGVTFSDESIFDLWNKDFLDYRSTEYAPVCPDLLFSLIE